MYTTTQKIDLQIAGLKNHILNYFFFLNQWWLKSSSERLTKIHLLKHKTTFQLLKDHEHFQTFSSLMKNCPNSISYPSIAACTAGYKRFMSVEI